MELIVIKETPQHVGHVELASCRRHAIRSINQITNRRVRYHFTFSLKLPRTLEVVDRSSRLSWRLERHCTVLAK